MKFFSFREIEQAGDCVRLVREKFGAAVQGGRCAATWRGGDNPSSVSITPKEWYDHKLKVGGGIIELCALAQFGSISEKQKSQEFLGNWLGLKPAYETRRREPKSTRLNALLADGYQIVRKYEYRDEQGEVVHTTTRLEKPGVKKEFVQSTPTSSTLEGVRTVLYNLPAVLATPEVWLAEGEKDAETLISWGFCGTTAPMGAGKWNERYTEWLRGKDVIIVRDRDEAGILHARHVAAEILPAVKSLRVLCPWLATKDVTEWAEAEGGTGAKLREAATRAPFVTDVAQILDDEAAAIAKAKELNKSPFYNYTLETVINSRGKTVTEHVPRQINDLVDETFGRFLGFPCRIGQNTLFDFDRDTDRIEYITSHRALFAWIGEKSRQIYSFKQIDGAVSKEEYYEGLLRRAPRYENIVKAPFWPHRADAFLAFREAIRPTKGHAALRELLSFFSPADEKTEVLLPAFFAAPIYYRPGIQRPAWVIDSADGAGVGKTTLVELLATLYRCNPIRTSLNQLRNDFPELVKNILSAGGRESRIVLVDNATGLVSSDCFADMVTASSLSGRVPYGRGEESRPNDITYCITANNASLSNDIASRSVCLMLKRPGNSVKDWKRAVLDYIERNRYSIFGDIVDALNAGSEINCLARTRYPEFEREVILPFCESSEAYVRAMEEMFVQRDSSNTEHEQGRQIEEAFALNLPDCGVPDPQNAVAFVRHEVYERWMKELSLSKNVLVSCIKAGYVHRFAKGDDFLRYPLHANMEAALGIPRATGVLWIGDGVNAGNYRGVLVVGRIRADKYGVVNTGKEYMATGYSYIREEIERRDAERAEAELRDAPQPAPPAPALPPSPAPAQASLDFTPPAASEAEQFFGPQGLPF